MFGYIIQILSIDMNIGIILIGLLCFTVMTVQHGKGREVHCEGRDVVLRFIFPRSDIDVTLQFGNRFPFYSNGQPVEAGLSKDQVYRFEVREYINDSQYVILLTISHLSRKDEGSYVGIAYENGEMITDLTRTIALIVEYPPGDPHCRHIPPSSIDVIHDTWDIIECTAPIGTMPGYIMCFQNNEPLPLHGMMHRNLTSVSQRLWVKRGYSFSCCSTDFRHRVNASSCKAFQYEMTQRKPTATPATYPMRVTSPNVTHSNEYTVTNTAHFNRAKYVDIFAWFIAEVLILTGLLFSSLLILFLVSKLIKRGEGKERKFLKGKLATEDRASKIDDLTKQLLILITSVHDNHEDLRKYMRQEFLEIRENNKRQRWNRSNENIQTANIVK